MNEEELRKQLKQEIKQELKKERKKRRIIIFVILAVVILGYIGYISINKEVSKPISEVEFEQYKEEITITTDNWKDYIIAENITEEMKNKFGQITKIRKNTVLKLKENICGYVIIEIKEKSMLSKQIIEVVGGDNDYNNLEEINTNYPLKHNEEKQIYDNTTTIDNIECIQIKGYIYKLHIPDSLWKIDKHTGKQVIKIRKDENSWLELIKEENYIYPLSNTEYWEREQLNKCES